MQHPCTGNLSNIPSWSVADNGQVRTAAKSILSTTTSPTVVSPRIKLSRSTTASELLAAFSPVKHLSRSTSFISPEAMATTRDPRDLRQKARISYTISDDSDSEASPSALSSAFTTPQKGAALKIIDLEEESAEELELRTSPPPRISSAGHQLRARSDLHLSLRAQENGDEPVIKKRKLTSASKSHRKKQKVIVTSDAKHGETQTIERSYPSTRTTRNEIRDAIATETAAKRAAFFTAKKEAFLPLLPESNYISRLVEKRDHSKPDIDNDFRSTFPYETIDVQPKG